jgi:hypothetical protein
VKARQHKEILADAIAVVGLPAETCGDLISTCMTGLRRDKDRLANAPTAAAMKEILRDRVKILRKARSVLVAMGSPPDFIAAFDGQVIAADSEAGGLKVPRGSKRPDLIGASAAIMARAVLRQFNIPATKTDDGAWYRLTSLIYEAATGIHDHNLSKYCREADLPTFLYATYLPKKRN